LRQIPKPSCVNFKPGVICFKTISASSAGSKGLTQTLQYS
jgi:hypothetical protein